MQAYVPSLLLDTLANLSVDTPPSVIREICEDKVRGEPWNVQEKVGAGSPSAAQDRVAVVPSRAMISVGWVVMSGGKGWDYNIQREKENRS